MTPFLRSSKSRAALFALTICVFSCSKGDGGHSSPGPAPTITSLSVNSGPCSTSVTINGTGFSTTVASDKVYFNGVQATVQSALSNAIYTNVPLAAGTGKVTVTVNGATATGPTFTYVPTEVATLLAGSGNPGWADGTGSAAYFSEIAGLATDASGNVYVADKENNVIRKITPAGLVTTYAGSGNGEYADGTGTAASFNLPSGVATDAASNVYVADTYIGYIRKITPYRKVSTLTVDGSGNPVAYGRPYFIAADAAGNVFFSDNGGSIVRELSTAGVVTTVYNGTSNNLTIFGLTVDKSDNLFITDGTQIDKITNGSIAGFAGKDGAPAGDLNGTGAAASFDSMGEMAIGGNNNGIYVLDTENKQIRMITPAAAVTTFGGQAPANFAGPAPVTDVNFGVFESIASDNSGNLYVGGRFYILKLSFQ